ncbi:MAG: CatB-related O-acetyltransferase [Clostridium sp.]|uniref:CatB-related O-acetyltransferase n=1 Tax=Clostridium sp. TaxID=1506 RepID=UPI00306954F0
MKNNFDSWLNSKILKGSIENPNIEVGEFTYYSGYYHKENFEDVCVRYLLGDESTKSYREIFGYNFQCDKLKIGKFCSIASGTVFMLAGNQCHNHKWVSAYPFNSDVFPNARDGFERKGDTIIGNDVWIGTEAVIMPGVKIGDGAVIGTRAVVTRDVGPYSVVVGNPGKSVKKRFSHDDIERLIEIKWWDWKIDTINEALKYICSEDIDGLYNFYKSNK